jgi:hypothetical protein
MVCSRAGQRARYRPPSSIEHVPETVKKSEGENSAVRSMQFAYPNLDAHVATNNRGERKSGVATIVPKEAVR